MSFLLSSLGTSNLSDFFAIHAARWNEQVIGICCAVYFMNQFVIESV